jgi:hypothetical protein
MIDIHNIGAPHSEAKQPSLTFFLALFSVCVKVRLIREAKVAPKAGIPFVQASFLFSK